VDAAVDAWINVGAVSVFGMPHDLDVFLAEPDHLAIDPQRVRHPTNGRIRIGPATAPEGEDEMDTMNIDPLLEHQLGGKGAVQTAGKQAHGSSISFIAFAGQAISHSLLQHLGKKVS
jgi:hypothetical protein